MSDPMSNREIEDVLTSIRRLVAQEGDRGVENGRLILTEAHRVSEQVKALGVAQPGTGPSGPVRADAEADTADADASAPLAPKAEDVSIPAPDFSKLEATIAELEAAVSGSEGDDAPAIGRPAPGKPSNVTELYGKMSFSHQPTGAANAEAAAAEGPEAEPTPEMADLLAPEETAADSGGVPETVAEVPAETAAEATIEPGAETDEDALADTILDEEDLRQFVALIVREELRGQLGERITQQVRKLVRAEIAKVLDERDLF
ncbi:hypothetical protein JI664_06920 [Rhodobacter sp. NTK016B]|uniref:hypothetical protein n=1 Tax=Rhodobacter sp. NTK016B TaxID=2759676 RepID=UPI001A8DE39B|nr:hypothetical protein [Rhodobacter sp. NTK016B]MBN8291690.1 hypothetical protein [Rhodobacter sp. NTK016B]